ncbi:PH domain-containing protein [Blastopirellula marina]|uniref:PH domain-containing protein n=1 Tax=Blastopirellula marina TaxID=124 RepID=UPI0011B0C856|nr:PH domain-containing protein [Blastopirellula marina]
MTILAGEICWSRFLRHQFLSLSSLGLSLAGVMWSLWSDFRGQIVVGGFSLILTTACVFFLLVNLSKTVTWYQLTGDRLSYGKLGRRRREVPLADIAWLPVEASPQDDLVISLRGGHMLEFGQAWLPDVTLLRETIRQRMPPPREHLEGELIRVYLATNLVFQAMIAAILLPIGILGCVIMAIAFHPAKPGSLWVFLPLGILIIGVVLVGLYHVLVRPWWGQVAWYRTSEKGLAYRTIFSRTPIERFWSEIDLQNSFPNWGSGDPLSTRGVICFHDGQRLAIDYSMLQNATKLPAFFHRYLRKCPGIVPQG